MNYCTKNGMGCEFANQNGDCSITACTQLGKLATSNTRTANMSIRKMSLGIACIVCGETVELTPNEEMSLRYGHSVGSKMCEKCKQAILYIRNRIE